MANLNNRSSVHPKLQVAVQQPLRGFQTATVQILNPHTEEYGVSDYDVFANTITGNPAVVLWSGTGQLQQFRSTLNAQMPVGTYTEIQSVRFTADITEAAIPVRKGFILKVVSCPTNPNLTSFQYTIISGFESALAFSRDIEAEVDQGVILGH